MLVPSAYLEQLPAGDLCSLLLDGIFQCSILWSNEKQKV